MEGSMLEGQGHCLNCPLSWGKHDKDSKGTISVFKGSVTQAI